MRGASRSNAVSDIPACWKNFRSYSKCCALEDFSENEEERIQGITDNIVKLLPTLIDKKIDTFSSKVNQNLNGI